MLMQVREAGPEAWLGREAPADPNLDGDAQAVDLLALEGPMQPAGDAERASAAAARAVVAGAIHAEHTYLL